MATRPAEPQARDRAIQLAPSGSTSRITQSDIEGFRWLAKSLIPSGMLPKHIKDEGQMVAIMLISDELGIGRMTGLRGMYVGQDGKPTMTTMLALGLMRSSPHWGDMKVVENQDNSITVTMARKGQSPHSETFGEAEAAGLGLTQKRNYQQQRRNMFKWRAIMACGRVVYPDVLQCIYTHEEMGLPVEMTEEGDFVLDSDAVLEGTKVVRTQVVPEERDDAEAKSPAQTKTTKKKPPTRKKTTSKKAAPEQKPEQEPTPPTEEQKAEAAAEGIAQNFTRQQTERMIELFSETYGDTDELVVTDDEGQKIKQHLANDQSYDEWARIIGQTETLIARRRQERAEDEGTTDEEQAPPNPFA